MTGMTSIFPRKLPHETPSLLVCMWSSTETEYSPWAILHLTGEDDLDHSQDTRQKPSTHQATGVFHQCLRLRRGPRSQSHLGDQHLETSGLAIQSNDNMDVYSSDCHYLDCHHHTVVNSTGKEPWYISRPQTDPCGHASRIPTFRSEGYS